MEEISFELNRFEMSIKSVHSIVIDHKIAILITQQLVAFHLLNESRYSVEFQSIQNSKIQI